MIICFAGRVSSGKTTLSKAMADALKWPRASFGDYVRKEARRQGLNESREVLQKIGASLVEDTDKFCNKVLDQVSWKSGQNLVIDGVRHSEILGSLKRLAGPSEVFLIFVETNEQTIRKRRVDKNTSGEDNLSDLEAHSTEREVTTALPTIADLVVDGAHPLDILVQEMVAWLKSKNDEDSIL